MAQDYKSLTIPDLQHKREAVWSQVVRSESVWSDPAGDLCRAFDELLSRYQALQAAAAPVLKLAEEAHEALEETWSELDPEEWAMVDKTGILDQHEALRVLLDPDLK